ncbi:uncharacterized protein EAF02_010230 [Botrytis sinoallii]|uniref:uncharacterized protein n=1 Tax=Botrytis sinoallii TaxID=1463999 RepID=UPI00190262BD|nr:uncharacterized protein EAF02_010230 [Botrytis sinoallii]KAF7864262.1 hypothetical protein EAF02_010230 [Botrytis sinoallii]
MATSSEARKPHDIVIDPEGDISIHLIKEETAKHPVTGEKSTIETTIACYKVSRKILSESSPVWDASLRGHFRESRSSTVPVYFGTLKSLELWFRIVHDVMVDEMYDIKVVDVYEAIEVCGNREWDIFKLSKSTWAREWMNRQKHRELDLDGMCRLIYLAKELDFPREFMYMTRKLVYGTAEHIKDRNPTNHQHLHLDHTVINALNGAKGNLRCKILKGLFTPVGAFLGQRCECKKDSLYEYCTGLSLTGIWPLETHMKKSAQEILDTFDDFQCDIPENACNACRIRLSDSSIERTGEQIQEHFDGLCLDCMSISKPKDGKNVDAAYWQHDTLRQYSMGCRVQHGQPTWYWSFMGRRTQMQAHQAARQR